MMGERSWRILACNFFFFLQCQESSGGCGEALEILDEQLRGDYSFYLSSNFTKDKKASETEAICRLKGYLNETYIKFILLECNLSKTCEETEPLSLVETVTFMTVKDFICMINNGSKGDCQNIINENKKLTCIYTSKATASATTTAATPSQTQKSTAVPTGSPQPLEYNFNTQGEMASFSLLGISILLNIILIFVVIYLMIRIRRHSNNMPHQSGSLLRVMPMEIDPPL